MSNLLEIPPSTNPNSLRPSTTDRHHRSGCKTGKRGLQKLQQLKILVEKAIQNHRTFTVLGPFTCVKNALKLRGWIEKLEARIREEDLRSERSLSRDLSPVPIEGLQEVLKNDSAVSDDLQISRLLRDYCVDFIWTMKNEPIKWKKLSAKTIVSRFPRADFTTKAGLCSSLQQSHWYHETNISQVQFPRCFNISNEEELETFVDNFRLTACISLVKFIQEVTTQDKSIFDPEGTIPLASIEFAIQRCKQYISSQLHEDIDQTDQEKIWDHQWDQFLTEYYSVAHEGAVFLVSDDDNEDYVKEIEENCQDLVQQLAEHWSQLQLDGTSNIWILKPAAKSRGRGICIMKKLEDILAKLGSMHTKDNRYVAQKYIERPLLIYDTKFDIRQWFLVTCAFPLTVWMYKESYLRFCSQLFSLINTHESVHLSNNAVQCKYTNAKRDQNLPDENMWDCYTFKTYLRSKGKPEIWETTIYPGMCQNIIGTLLASQDTMDHRRNCFELFGADFMLTDNCQPWLIEINSGPSMSPSTSITARMCAQVMDDVIKGN
ncbi:tubulin glycylase 3A-like isoform X2 [Planococcus citri]|uniref:tubulin glycylase 3A-like isoform X2 n=1 Tax=Planococcus citri TaxID=170843 RepID=UPI0031F99CDE